MIKTKTEARVHPKLEAKFIIRAKFRIKTKLALLISLLLEFIDLDYINFKKTNHNIKF